MLYDGHAFASGERGRFTVTQAGLRCGFAQ
jgi:hypothetical protein